MNELQARQEGLHFTGIYSSHKDEVKNKIAEARKEFPKARIVLVNVPRSKLSRSGPGMGYSAYADNIYRAYQTINDCNKTIANYTGNIEYHRKKFEDEKTRLDEQLKAATEKLTDAIAQLNNQAKV